MTMNGIETAFIARVGTEPELKVSQAGWRVEQLGQIGKNKPAQRKAPPEGELPASAPIANSDNRGPLRHWERPADEEIPFAPEVRSHGQQG